MTAMLEHAEAFFALSGGLGILEEICHIFSWAQLNIHQKPIGLLNVNGFYNNLLSFLDHVMEHNSSSTGDARRTKFLIIVLLMT